MKREPQRRDEVLGNWELNDLLHPAQNARLPFSKTPISPSTKSARSPFLMGFGCLCSRGGTGVYGSRPRAASCGSTRLWHPRFPVVDRRALEQEPICKRSAGLPSTTALPWSRRPGLSNARTIHIFVRNLAGATDAEVVRPFITAGREAGVADPPRRRGARRGRSAAYR